MAFGRIVFEPNAKENISCVGWLESFQKKTRMSPWLLGVSPLALQMLKVFAEKTAISNKAATQNGRISSIHL